jgi:hypothetical protein
MTDELEEAINEAVKEVYRPTRKTTFQQAANAVLSSRASAYGAAENNFANIAALWNAYLRMIGSRPLVGGDVAIMMVQLKLARLATNPTHEDSWVDIAGYAACGAAVSAAEVVKGAPSPEAS